MKRYFETHVGTRRYIMKGKRAIYAEWDGKKWKQLPWPTRR